MIAGRHSRFLQLAAQVAENSEQETKHGSLLVRGGKVLAAGQFVALEVAGHARRVQRYVSALRGDHAAAPAPVDICHVVSGSVQICSGCLLSVIVFLFSRLARRWRPPSVGFTRLKVMSAARAGSFGGVTST